MAPNLLWHCGQPGRLLTWVSYNAYVDYFRCETCGHVWACEKGTSNVVHIATKPKTSPHRTSDYDHPK